MSNVAEEAADPAVAELLRAVQSPARGKWIVGALAVGLIALAGSWRASGGHVAEPVKPVVAARAP